LFPFKDKARVQICMNSGTLNRARMLEHSIQHLIWMHKPYWNIVSNYTNMDICFSNNAGITNTQQSPPLTNFWLKQIKANLLNKQRDIEDNHFSKRMNTYVWRNS